MFKIFLLHNTVLQQTYPLDALCLNNAFYTHHCSLYNVILHIEASMLISASRNVPITLVRRFISLFTRSITLLVHIRSQCSDGNFTFEQNIFDSEIVPAEIFCPQRIIVRKNSLYVYNFKLILRKLLYVINLTTLKLTLQ